MVSLDRFDPKIRAILDRFPKSRPPLPEAHRQRYVADYRENRQGRSGVARLVAGLEAWMHRSIAEVPGSSILELGAGTLNHLPFESTAERYDVIEPFHELWQDSPELGRVTCFYDDIREVSPDDRYDKIISVAVLEHLVELPDVIAHCALRLAAKGAFAAGFPTEGGLAWYSAWRFGTGTAYGLRTGMDYAPLMRHEHVNKAYEIDAVLRLFFPAMTIRRFPLPWFHGSLYTTIVASNPDRRACEEWLGR